MSCPIIIALATFPPRKEGLLKVIDDLINQCDKMCIYMNGYNEVPEELKNESKINIVLAGDQTNNPDLGSHGKFFWLNDQDHCYYLTVDDDIIYPSNYVETIVTGIDKYARKAIVGFHGGIFKVREGGAFVPNKLAKDNRILYPYDAQVKVDLPVHIIGSGTMGCFPSEIKLSFDQVKGDKDSGDDEDLAIWAQKTKVPMVRLKTPAKWILPNNKAWIQDPLHRRRIYILKSDEKLKSWKSWYIHKPTAISAVNATQFVYPRFDDIKLTKEDLDYCYKMLSSDALAAIIIDRIRNKIPTSVVRMADGERAIIEYSKGIKAFKDTFLLDKMWLKKYGLTDANLKLVGENLIKAGNEADFLACSISGLFWPMFKVHHYFPERQQFIDQFYPQFWETKDRVGPILRAGHVLVFHRECQKIVPELKSKYELKNIDGMMLDSWKDHDRLMETAKKHPATTILVSGGPSGKYFCVQLAKEAKKVVLDVGEALAKIWAGI